MNQKQVHRCHSSRAGSRPATATATAIATATATATGHCKLRTFRERRYPHLLPCWVTLMPSRVKCRARCLHSKPQLLSSCLPMSLKCRTGVLSHNDNWDAPKVMSQVKWGLSCPSVSSLRSVPLRGSFTIWRYASTER